MPFAWPSQRIGGDPTQDGCAFHVSNLDALFAEFQAKSLQNDQPNFDVERHGDAHRKVFYVVAPDGLCYWGNVAEIAALDTLPAPPAFVQPEAATAAELVPALTASVAKAKQHLAALDDEAMGKMWRLLINGREVMAMPRAAFARAIMLNHWYHHRGQLLVYLRLLNLSVPSVYGPTADENPFAG